MPAYCSFYQLSFVLNIIETGYSPSKELWNALFFFFFSSMNDGVWKIILGKKILITENII